MGSVKGQGTIQSTGGAQKNTLQVYNPEVDSFNPTLVNPIRYTTSGSQNPQIGESWNITITGAGTAANPYVAALDTICE
jgi:hypothetical protein